MDDLVVIGKIKGIHGQSGAVRVIPLTDFPERFKGLARIFLTNDDSLLGDPYQIERVAYKPKFISVKLAHINSAKQAWELNNLQVVLPIAERMPLDEGSYYVSDLVGLRAVDREGKRLGVLTDVIETGAHSVYLIEDEGREILLPALKETIIEVNLADGVIKVSPWEYADDED